MVRDENRLFFIQPQQEGALSIMTSEDKERFNSKDNTITAPISIPSDCL
jgi:hypothetical protein